MTTAAWVMVAITGALLLLGAWIGMCIDANRRAADHDGAARRLSKQVVDELNLLNRPEPW
jgi:hypothetical protein